MIVLKTELRHRYGANIVLPGVGEVKVSEKGEIEVATEEERDIILAAEVGFSEVARTTGNLTDKTSLEPQTENPDLGGITTEKTLEPQVEETTPLGDPLPTTGLATEVIPPAEITTSEDTATTTVVPESTTTTVTDPTTSTTESDTKSVSSIEEVKAALSTLKMPELQEQASPFPKTEWAHLNKANLLEYLVGKLQA